MNPIEVRPTIPADLDALAEILLRVHATDGYPVEGVEDPRAWVDLSSPIGQWTALLDGHPLGHVALLRPAPGDGAPALLSAQEGVSLDEMAVVSRLFVAPQFRGRAVAGGLMTAAEDAASDLGLRVVLDVLTKDAGAIGLYRARQWREIGQHDHVYAGGRSPALAMVGPSTRS